MYIHITIIAEGTVLLGSIWLNIHSMLAQKENQMQGSEDYYSCSWGYETHGPWVKGKDRDNDLLMTREGHQSGQQVEKLNLIQMTVYDGLSMACVVGRHGDLGSIGRIVGHFTIQKFPPWVEQIPEPN